MENSEGSRPTAWWSRIAAAPRRLSFWMNGISATLAAILLFGDRFAGLAQGKAILWCFEAVDRFRGELIAVCILIFFSGWLTASLVGAVKGIGELLRRGSPSKAQAGVLFMIGLLVGVMAIVMVRAGRSYVVNRIIAWRRYETALVSHAQQALADQHEARGKFLLRVAAEVGGNRSAQQILDDISAREHWSADFWAFYGQVPKGSLARWEMLHEEAPFELNRDRLESEAERIRSRYWQERPRFVEAISLLEKGQASRATEELKQVCNALQWIGNCRVLLRDLESGKATPLLAALKRYGADRFSAEILELDDSRMKVDLFEPEGRLTYKQLLKMGLIPSPEPSTPDCGESETDSDDE